MPETICPSEARIYYPVRPGPIGPIACFGRGRSCSGWFLVPHSAGDASLGRS